MDPRVYLCLTAILIIAASLRFLGLGHVPPGLAHDEVANWLIARDILDGRHAIYFTAAYGHEPLYQYLQAGTVALFGDHWLGLRYPSAALGLLGLAVTTALTRRLFDRTVALIVAAYLAVGFWPVFYSRLALRAIALPLTAALAAYFLFGLLRFDGEKRRGLGPALGFGVFLGISLYTYMAARILPFIFLAFIAYLALFHRQRLRGRWGKLILAALVAALVAAPLLIWLATHPGAEARVAEVREPLDRLLAGDPSLVWENLKANLRMFTFEGDPWPRQNVPGRPVFPDSLNGLLFCAGVGIALWRWREPRYAFLLIFLMGSLVPSVVTSVAPSSIRDILALVVVFAFPAMALAAVTRRLSPPDPRRSTLFAVLVVSTCALTLGIGTLRDYFVRWPRDSVVRFDYQAALTAAARRVDALGGDVPAVVSGLSIHTMDRPGLQLAARRGIDQVRLCDTRESLVVPGRAGGHLLVPEVVPFDGRLRRRLLTWGGREVDSTSGSFAEYILPGPETIVEALPEVEVRVPEGTSVSLPASFEGHVSLVGVDWIEGQGTPGGRLTLVTAWRVESPPSTPLKAFVHLLDANGQLQAQHDGLASPPQGWREGDLILQLHTLALPTDLEAGTYTLQVGVYWAPDGPRLSSSGADRLLLSPIEVEVP